MVKFLSKAELEKLTTKRLLAYKNQLMTAVETPNWDECDDDRVNKTHPEWNQVYRDVKEVLATRENVEEITNERDLKEAIRQGKILKKKLDAEKAAKAKADEEARKAEEIKKAKELRDSAQYYLNTLTDKITKAVSRDEKSFELFSCEINGNYAKNGWYTDICKIIKPKLDKMGLKYFETNKNEYVVLGYDPDYGYDGTSVILNVYVPGEQ